MVTVAFSPTDSCEGLACSICGCLVDPKATDKHVVFHESLARLLGIVED